MKVAPSARPLLESRLDAGGEAGFAELAVEARVGVPVAEVEADRVVHGVADAGIPGRVVARALELLVAHGAADRELGARDRHAAVQLIIVGVDVAGAGGVRR